MDDDCRWKNVKDARVNKFHQLGVLHAEELVILLDGLGRVTGCRRPLEHTRRQCHNRRIAVGLKVGEPVLVCEYASQLTLHLQKRFKG